MLITAKWPTTFPAGRRVVLLSPLAFQARGHPWSKGWCRRPGRHLDKPLFLRRTERWPVYYPLVPIGFCWRLLNICLLLLSSVQANSFARWAEEGDPQCNVSGCWVPLSATAQLPWKTNPINLTEWSCLHMIWKVVLGLGICFMHSDTSMCKSVIPLWYTVAVKYECDVSSSLLRVHAEAITGRLYGSGEGVGLGCTVKGNMGPFPSSSSPSHPGGGR